MKIEIKKLRGFVVDNIIISYECPLCSFRAEERGIVCDHILGHSDEELKWIFSN